MIATTPTAPSGENPREDAVDEPSHPAPRAPLVPARPRLAVSRGLRVFAALVTLLTSCGAWAGAARLHEFTNRGVVGTLPAANAPAVPGRAVGMQVFLDKEVEPEKIRRTVEMLREANVSWVRQGFSWCEIESDGRGQFWDSANKKPSWQKFDFVVDTLNEAGIKVMARLDNAPAWSRPGKGTGACGKGPPNDLNTYSDFVRTLTSRYKGKIAAVQIWNEPNLGPNEWDGAVNVVQYVDMLKRSYAAAKEGDPNVLVVTAAMAPTKATPPEHLSDLLFYEQMYKEGAKGTFDVLAVQAYGLGEPPDDRRLDAGRFNVSRPIMVREIMERYDDAHTPIWVTEFGYNSLPQVWDGKPSIWGENVDEATQAQYLVGGLQRMTTEWPWLGMVFIWGFRWVEPPGLFGKNPANPTGPKEPEPYFAVVNYDFTPRPAWLAIREYARGQTLRPGRFAPGDPLVRMEPGWQRGSDGVTTSLVGTDPNAALTIPLRGSELATTSGEGSVRVSVDGHDRGTVRLDPDSVTTLATNLTEGGTHTVTLKPAGGTARIGGWLVGRRTPFDWAFPLLTLGAALIAAGAVGAIALESWRGVRGRHAVLSTGAMDTAAALDAPPAAPPPVAPPPARPDAAPPPERGDTPA